MRNSTGRKKGSRRDPNPKGFKAGDQRCTPRVVWQAALEAIGVDEFDLDPATNPFSTVPAKRRLMGGHHGSDPKENGLTVEWYGHVWLNFPFSQPVPWVERAVWHASTYRTQSITILGPNVIDTNWFQALMLETDARADWPRREHFPTPDEPEGSPMGGFSLYYLGPAAPRWRRAMRDCGCITYSGRQM